MNKTEYVSVVNDVKDIIKKQQVSEVTSYYMVGERLQKLQADNDASEILEKVAKDVGVKRSTLYYALRFNKEVSKTTLAEIQKAGLSWRNVIPLLRKGMTDEQRLDIIRSVKAGDVPRLKIDDKVKDTLGIEPKAKPEHESEGSDDGDYIKPEKQSKSPGVDSGLVFLQDLLNKLTKLSEDVTQVPEVVKFAIVDKQSIGAARTLLKSLDMALEKVKRNWDKSVIVASEEINKAK